MSPEPEPERAALADVAEPPPLDAAPAEVEAETPNSVMASQLAGPGAEQAGGPGPMGPMVVPVRGPTMGISSAIGDALGDLFDTRPNEELLDAKEELESFRDSTFPEKKNHRPSSGLGQFDVACNMRAGTMMITLRLGYSFVDGMAGRVVPGYRPDEFKWKPEEIATWKARYQRDVASRWSSRFQIKSTRKYWESMVVNTTVRVVEDSAAPHFKLSVAKYPSDAKVVGSDICGPGTHHKPGTSKCIPNTDDDDLTGTGSLDSNDLRAEAKLDRTNAVTSIPFAEGSAALSAAGSATAVAIASSLSWSDQVEITGRNNKKHNDAVSWDDAAVASMDLARARSAAVRAALLAGGASEDQILVRNAGEDQAGEGAEWCRVDVKVGTHQTQTPAIHETGHMLGNDDEYVTGVPLEPGYVAMLKTQTGDTVAVGANEGAMSMGATVQRWNYAAFLEALKAVTGNDDWSL